MPSRSASVLCRLTLAGAAIITLTFLGDAAEAQSRDTAQAKSRRTLPAAKAARPLVRFLQNQQVQEKSRRKRRENAAAARRGKRSPHQPGALVRTTPPKPPCGVRGKRPCPGTPPSGGRVVIDPPARCGTARTRPCADGPPIIVTPGDWIKDPERYIGALTTRVERAPPPRTVAATEPTARQLLVLVAQNQPAATEAQIANSYRLQRISGSPIPLLDARAQVYRINDNRSVQSVIAALSSDPRVLLVQRNLVYQRQGAAGSEAVRAAQYGFTKVGAPSAHEISTGRGVKVAIVDTGISSDHPDLDGAVVNAFDATGSKDQAPDMHGTAIAGIVRARGLVSGIAPDATLLAVRAFVSAPKRALPESTSFILLRALDWSVREGAHVINMSFSGSRDPAIERIVAESARRKVILVAAAGNGGPEAAPSYPAAYENVIAVTAHDRADKLYVHANHGTYISVAAPGVDILVPVLKNGHMFMSGTSMSAAYVTGIVALLLERAPGMAPEMALRLLAQTAEDLGKPGIDDEFGAGRVQARAALDAMLVQAKEVGARQ